MQEYPNICPSGYTQVFGYQNTCTQLSRSAQVSSQGTKDKVCHLLTIPMCHVFFSGWWPCPHFAYACLVPSKSWQWLFSLHLVPSLWVFGTYSQSFVSWAGCPEKLHVEVLRPQWSANLGAVNPWESYSIAVYSSWACTLDFSIHTLLKPVLMLLLKFCMLF